MVLSRWRKWSISAVDVNVEKEWISTGAVSGGIMSVGEQLRDARQDVHRTVMVAVHLTRTHLSHMRQVRQVRMSIMVAVHLTDVYNIKPLLVGRRLVFNNRLYKRSSALSVDACNTTDRLVLPSK